MQSLFVQQAPKKGRVCLMLGASLLFHGGIVGIAALWLQPDPPDKTVITWFPVPGEEGPVPIYPTPGPESSQTPDATTPTPPEIELPIPTPPTVESELDMDEPSKPTPTPRRSTVTKTTTVSRPTGPQSTATATTKQLGNGPASGTNAGPTGAVGAWVMPHPLYPRMNSVSRPTGSTTVRISTDPSGRVSNVVIIKSAGNPILDHQTESFVRMNWHGPPNASRTTEFVYQIK